MHKNNMCVIYDTDTKYAMKLMNVINSDQQIPFGAQVFTEQEQLNSYLQDYEPRILMVSEDVCRYHVTDHQKAQLVVLCDDESQVMETQKQYGEQAIGVYKYQSSSRILKKIIQQGREGIPEDIDTQLVGIIGADVYARNILSITTAYLLGRKEPVLYVNLDEFPGLEQIFPAQNNLNLSDAFYWFKQKGYRYCDEIRRTICHMEQLDYIAPVQCAEDISYMDAQRVVQFMLTVGQELGYGKIVLDISNGVRTSWHILESCKSIYVPDSDNEFLKRKQKAMECYFLESGMGYMVDKMIHISMENQGIQLDEQFWKQMEYSPHINIVEKILFGGV